MRPTKNKKPDPIQINKSRLFHDKMVEYLEEYKDYLLLVKSDGSSVSHGDLIHQFINFIYGHHLISDLSQITVSLVNSKFYAYFRKMNVEDISKDELKRIQIGRAHV